MFKLVQLKKNVFDNSAEQNIFCQHEMQKNGMRRSFTPVTKNLTLKLQTVFFGTCCAVTDTATEQTGTNQCLNII